MTSQENWIYERGDGRHKHCWSKEQAGFVGNGAARVGKCAASITDSVAVDLLRSGVIYHAPGTQDPEHVYAVYRGVIYEAAPTRPGMSFHGYPWSGGQGRPALPPRILRELQLRATQEGYLEEFNTWLKQYS